MPLRDGSGPMGNGRLGRGLGPCGRGRQGGVFRLGGGFRRRAAMPADAGQDQVALARRVDELQAALDELRGRLASVTSATQE